MVLEKLIVAVGNFRAIWDVPHMCYRDNRARENTWKKKSLEVRNICLSSSFVNIFAFSSATAVV